MTSTLSTPHNRKMTLILLAICGLLTIAAVVVGIDDNLPGILLACLAGIAFVLAFVHPWRTVKKFFLLLASVLGFVLYIILNIILDVTAQASSTSALQDVLQSPVVNALSTIIVMVCPAALIVGAVGSVAMFFRNRRQPA
jgi:hypothetical protein